MYEDISHPQWPIIKYKELKRSSRKESEHVRVVLNETRRILTVFCGAEQVEQIYCNMEVSKFPALKMKCDQLFVLVNSQSQGFRITFRRENRNQFLAKMRKIAYISETPEKNHLNRSFTNTDIWSSSAEKNKKQSVSCSQPVYSHHSGSTVRSPQRKSAKRNLANTMSSRLPESSYIQERTISPVTFYSQPTRNPYSRPMSSTSYASSVSSSISSALNSLNDDPFLSLSQNSGSSCVSPYSCDYPRSPFSNSQCSDQFESYYTNSRFDTDPPYFSQSPSHLSPITRTDNKCIQTDSILIDQLTETPDFMNTFMLKVLKSAKFGNLVRTMRSQIHSIPSDAIECFRKKVDHNSPSMNLNATVSAPRQPTVSHMTSDLEYDVFADL